MYNVLSSSDFKKIQLYILNNCLKIESYLDLHKEEVQGQSLIDVQQRHENEFPFWFNQYPYQQYEIDDVNEVEQIESLLRKDVILDEISGSIVTLIQKLIQAKDKTDEDSVDEGYFSEEEDNTIIDYCNNDTDDKEDDNSNSEDDDNEDDGKF
ncbi:conserved hypothetical protein [Ricinus communis]|uniref:Uncharacterized protein n=1 Tax=Ricinus communis TaxID=3988 RepID=B9SNK8_RICCO|nr:conserved hypothetical protein [Ricinus communis]